MCVLRGHLLCGNLWIWDQKVAGELSSPRERGCKYGVTPLCHEVGRMQNWLHPGFPTCRVQGSHGGTCVGAGCISEQVVKKVAGGGIPGGHRGGHMHLLRMPPCMYVCMYRQSFWRG